MTQLSARQARLTSTDVPAAAILIRLYVGAVFLFLLIVGAGAHSLDTRLHRSTAASPTEAEPARC